MWAFAIYDLELTEQQFRKLTLKLFDELAKRKKYKDKTTDFYFARLALYLGGKEGESISDYMIYHEEEVVEGQNVLQSLNAMFGGEDLRKNKPD